MGWTSARTAACCSLPPATALSGCGAQTCLQTLWPTGAFMQFCSTFRRNDNGKLRCCGHEKDIQRSQQTEDIVAICLVHQKLFTGLTSQILNCP